VEKAPKGVPIVQWEKDASEDFGLVKIDLLGNRSLAVIRDAVENVRANGLRFDEDRWDPEGDAATVELLARGDSIGVFYVESPAMRQLQKKTGKGDFEHLVIHSSIIRPAANTYIREYVRRLKGGAWDPLHPLLDGVLSETFGIMCYQEDVSRAAIALAGFSHEEGDALRKVLSKKDRARRLPDFKARFLSGAGRKGVDGDTAEKVWEMMESFAGYSFCKPHSASYAKVSFQSAFIKAHHPAEFIAAVISNQGGYYTTFAYVSEAGRMGLKVLAPCVNASVKKFAGLGRELRTGLMQVKGLSGKSIDDVLDARGKDGPFRSIDDFVRRTRIPRPEVESLVVTGAFDSISGGLSKPQLLWKLCALEPRPAPRGKTLELFDENTLPVVPAKAGTQRFGSPPARGRHDQSAAVAISSFIPHPSSMPSLPVPSLPEYSPARLRGLEFEKLGFLCSDHPLKFYLERRPGLRYVKGSALGAHVGRRIRTIGWLVTGKLVYSRHGEPMEFVSFEDTDAIYETTFFPDAFKKFAHMLDRTRPYVLSGKVDEDFGAHSLTVEDVEFM
jgi:DNA polymerase-3 subunit alpha/error-prone DNA polymerase